MGWSPAKVSSPLDAKAKGDQEDAVHTNVSSGQTTETNSPERVYILASSRTPSPPAGHQSPWSSVPGSTSKPRLLVRQNGRILMIYICADFSHPPYKIPAPDCLNTPGFALRRQSRQNYLKEELAKLEESEQSRVPTTPVRELDERFYGSIEEAYTSLQALEERKE